MPLIMLGITYAMVKNDDHDGLSYPHFLDALLEMAFECGRNVAADLQAGAAARRRQEEAMQVLDALSYPHPSGNYSHFLITKCNFILPTRSPCETRAQSGFRGPWVATAEARDLSIWRAEQSQEI